MQALLISADVALTEFFIRKTRILVLTLLTYAALC
jgi:hypothetical protein